MRNRYRVLWISGAHPGSSDSASCRPVDFLAQTCADRDYPARGKCDGQAPSLGRRTWWRTPNIPNFTAEVVAA
ncbi:hypothetical protein [Microbulbifer spongiae]|uniref:Uncharacterized protein n=1 Tax=Microbulbifer spongiae TaxID=2944933 RepID=A0ABY9ECD9_9GAMM|nr:hypothetical protein [Microbulbifer sp. MI-G]WKD50693.1 hypothetical protein M8T91_04495 [Microbulbifer sp. MI-G]